MPDNAARPMTRERDERFANLVTCGETYLSAWCESAEGTPKPAPTASARVQASRMAKRCADRIAYLKARRVAETASEDGPVPITAESLSEIMEDTTRTLMRAATAAQRAGSAATAQNLRRCVVTHAGRAHRVEIRAPKTADDGPTIPVAEYIARLRPCECLQ